MGVDLFVYVFDRWMVEFVCDLGRGAARDGQEVVRSSVLMIVESMFDRGIDVSSE